MPRWPNYKRRSAQDGEVGGGNPSRGTNQAHVVQGRDGALKTRRVSVQIRPWALVAVRKDPRVAQGRGTKLKPSKVQVQVLPRGPFNRKENMKSRAVMEMGDYRLLPKGLRRMLVFSETFFFREYGKAKTPRKTRREEVLNTSSSLAFCE